MVTKQEVEKIKKGNIRIELLGRVIEIKKINNKYFVCDTDNYNPELGEINTIKELTNEDFNKLVSDIVLILINNPLFRITRI